MRAEAERRQQRNRLQQQHDMLNHGKIRHCTYYDAQFSRDGSHYALVCLGPSVPYVTLHKIVMNDGGEGADKRDVIGEPDGTPEIAKNWLNTSSSSYQFVSLVENNTYLQVTLILLITIAYYNGVGYKS